MVGTGTTNIISSSVGPTASLAGLAAGPYNITLTRAGTTSSQPVMALADLNNDGYDDFAFSSSSTLDIYYGQNLNSWPSTPSIVINGSNLTATTGDFNGDQQLDLAVSSRAGGGMYLFYSASRLATTSPTNLSQADVVLPFVNTFSTDLSRASNNIDIDGDQIDDLVFSNAQATSSSGNASAGRLYVVRGAYTKTQLPTSGVTDLENFSVPGSGSYLVDRSTGRPQLFNNAGAPFTIALARCNGTALRPWAMARSAMSFD